MPLAPVDQASSGASLSQFSGGDLVSSSNVLVTVDNKQDSMAGRTRSGGGAQGLSLDKPSNKKQKCKSINNLCHCYTFTDYSQ